MKKLGISIAVGLITVLGLVAAPGASAAFGVKSWEAGTCTKDIPQCTYQNDPSQFFTQAAGRPNVGLTDFVFNTDGLGLPEGKIKNVRVDLPEGLNVNPQATAQCPKETFEAGAAGCPAGSQVGVSEVTSFSLLEIIPAQLSLPVYNIVPDQGHPALFGFSVPVINKNVYLQADIAWATDFHEGFTISDIPNELPLTENRLVFNGRAGDGTFLTMGSECNGPSTTTLAVESYEEAKDGPIPTTPPANIDGCQKVPFAPGLDTGAGGATTDTAAPISVALNVPQGQGGEQLNDSTVKQAQVTLARGVGLNPEAAEGLEACTNAQFHGARGETAAVACPAKSQIGTVKIEAPALPAGSLTGNVYLGNQLSRDPTSGQEFRIFIAAASSRYGVEVRREGRISANPTTGQLTTTVSEAPQVSFSSFQLSFGGGPTKKLPLTSPPVCGPNTSSGKITPWSGNAAASPSTNLAMSKAPGGGPCAKTMAERPFAPGFSAKPVSAKALDYTPFQLNITRNTGQQELKGVNVILPPGATAKLAGVSYCTPVQLAAAANPKRSGAEEKKKASCPSDSEVGVATIRSGSGSAPLTINGKAYLAGPYQGAPLSLAVVTPALAGPFDLGNVIVRVPLFVDPETAQIHPVTTAIPDVFGGAKLDIRSISVNVNRPNFTLNGTNCSQFATEGLLYGGGADPTNPATFGTAKVADPSKLAGCEALGFKPKMKLRTFGATKRAKHPKLRAELKARSGDANLSRVSVALPHALFLDQASLSGVCTRVQYAAQQCPKKSIYGRARAFSPLLGKPLEGPVYLRSSNNLLPDMVAHLEGQIDIDLDGRIDSFKGGIRTTFDRVPDVPVEKFVLNLRGGKHGLLVASRNLCAKKPIKAIVQLKGQNGKKANKRVKLKSPCHKKKHGKKHKQAGARRAARSTPPKARKGSGVRTQVTPPVRDLDP